MCFIANPQSNGRSSHALKSCIPCYGACERTALAAFCWPKTTSTSKSKHGKCGVNHKVYLFYRSHRRQDLPPVSRLLQVIVTIIEIDKSFKLYQTNHAALCSSNLNGLVVRFFWTASLRSMICPSHEIFFGMGICMKHLFNWFLCGLFVVVINQCHSWTCWPYSWWVVNHVGDSWWLLDMMLISW